MRLVVARDSDELAALAADLFRARLRDRPELAMAVPAGRTPRRMYARLQELQAHDPVDFRRMRVFAVDELCPPAPPDGYSGSRSGGSSWPGPPYRLRGATPSPWTPTI